MALYENQFCRSVSENAGTSILKRGGIEKRGLSKKEVFVRSTFDYMMEIIRKSECLDYCSATLGTYKSGWRKTFSRADYIRHTLEKWLGDITGILDRCLLLVNHVYDLGTKNEEVRYKLIISNKHISGEPVKSAIQKLNKVIGDYRPARNYVEHQGQFKDEKLDKLASEEFILSQSKSLIKSGVLTVKKAAALNVAVKLGFKFYVKDRKREIKLMNTDIRKPIDEIFSALTDPYQKRTR